MTEVGEMDTEKERPNIRIEIRNEKMEIDESENEDGEIVDEEPAIQVLQNPRTVFTTGINIFDHEEQKKLQERAKRFALRPEEVLSFTDADLEELRESLGITEENESVVRFDTIHILGTKDLVIEDILEYFVKYAPTGVEVVDEQSVNIKWLENITAARAMFFSSKPVKGMPVREQILLKDFLDTDQVDENEGQSILLKDREVELQVEVTDLYKKAFKNAVDIKDITIPIPPGYWRLGDKHPKAKCLLLRFAFKTDKKPYKVESLAKYYKKIGNSKSFGERRKESIFARNRDLPRSKNPWGNLARNWDQDAKFRETIPTSGETVEIKNPKLATRLGIQTVSESDDEVEIVEVAASVPKKKDIKKGRTMRMRMYADEEEERLKMKKAIQKIKMTTEQLIKEPRDLRTILSLNNNSVESFEPVDVIDLAPEDLGNRLKNRSRHMVFSIQRETTEPRTLDRKENIRADVRSILNRRRIRSPHMDRERDIRVDSSRYRDRSPIKRYESPVRQRSSHRHRTPERTVRYQRLSRFREDGSDYRDRLNGTKPRSKVAVVVRTRQKPAVASTIWSRVKENSESGESSSSGSEEDSSEESESSGSSESSEGSESETESSESSEAEVKEERQMHRPGFDSYTKVRRGNSFKVTALNDHYRRR